MLNISIVLYHPKWEEEVLPLLRELLRVKNLRKIYLLDNNPSKPSLKGGCPRQTAVYV